MALFCRNPRCEYHTKPFEGFPQYCPNDGLPIMGSVIESEVQLAPHRKEPPAGEPESPPPAAPNRAEAAPSGRPARRRTKPVADEPPHAPRDPEADRPSIRPIFDIFSKKLLGSERPRTEPTGAAGSGPEAVAPELDRPRPPDGPKIDPRATQADGPRRASPTGGFARYQLSMLDDPTWKPRTIGGPYHKPLYRRKITGEAEDSPRQAILDLQNTPRGLELTPADTVNGVFLRIDAPVELATGARFRVGDYVLEYRACRSNSPVRPLICDGERFWARDPDPMDVLVFIRPDGSDGPSVPLLRPLILGRGGPDDPPVDVPLFDDNISRRHARLAATRDGAQLEDLGSTNGTFRQLTGPHLVADNAVIRLGAYRLRVDRIG